MSATDQIGSGSGIDAETWAAAQSSPEFTNLRRRLRNFVFPVSALFLAWYLVYVLLADYAHGFMSIKLAGNINIGLVLGLLQFVSTFAITTWYVRYANRNLDPVAEEIRDNLEGGAGEKVPVATTGLADAADPADAAEKSDDAEKPDDADQTSADDGRDDATEKDAADATEKDAADATEKDAADAAAEKDDVKKDSAVEGGQK